MSFKLLQVEHLSENNWYLSNLVAFLRINLFVKIDLQKWLNEPFSKKEKPPDNSKQGSFSFLVFLQSKL